MRYFPILEELFGSDSVIIFLAGICASLFAGLKIQKRGKAALICLAVYALCELLSGIFTQYFAQIILLFVGTLALGAFAGFAVAYFIAKLRGKRGADK